jgi:hypothetical protein
MRHGTLTTFLLAALLAGCTTGTRGSRRPRAEDPVRGPEAASGAPEAAAPRTPRSTEGDPGVVPGTPPIRIVWQALYVEQERFRNSKWRPTNQETFGEPDFEVILVNASFVPTPEQDRENRSEIAVGRLARVPDADMVGLVAELERLGFFRYAKPTDAVRPYFGSERARGRVTVERGGESLTLVSYRGLGLQDQTREIPQIYAQAKYAIQVLKNRNPSMAAKSAKVEPLRPKTPAPSGGVPGSGTSAPAPK